ncbi:hypothetical protein GGR52DRAFT_180431 [Hypoxylon sp. FL1284]|nr:hypothetical protein GGR52DRAFT_180431 [Hypoxylon sp. FL1284]
MVAHVARAARIVGSTDHRAYGRKVKREPLSLFQLTPASLKMHPIVTRLLVVTLIYWVLHFIGRSRHRSTLSYIPFVHKSWWQPWESISSVVERGYASISKKQGLPFRIAYWGQEYVVLPAKYLSDLRHADKDHLNFFKSMGDVLFLKFWIRSLFDTDRMVYTIKKGLDPHLNEATDLCIDELKSAIQDELGPCDSFTSFRALDVFGAITHRMASKVIVGDELCRDPAFSKASQDYFRGHVMTGYFLLLIPSERLRNILSRPLSYFQRSRKRRALGLVSAVMSQRLEAKTSGSNSVEKIDCIEWSLRIKDDFPLSPGEDLLW